MAYTLTRTFESLRVRNYRLFFTGQVVSWTGTWVQWVAMGWLVLELTGSGFALGLVTALGWLPILIFGAWAGVVADRFDKRHLLVATNVASALLSLALGLSEMAGVASLGLVIALAFLLGIVTAVDNPARQTFTLEMVGPQRLTNAVSLNTATFTTARVLGPAAAGLLISSVGIGVCFIINAVSYIPITLALFAMNKEELRSTELVGRKKGQVREGLRYVMSTPVLKTLMIMMAVIGAIQYNFQVILPVLVRDTFNGDARTLGLMGAVLGLGMFSGSIANAAFGRQTRRVLLVTGTTLGALSIAVGAAPPLWLVLLLMIPLGMASMAFLATMNSTLQLTSTDAMRGRVMALYFVLFLGTTPIGAPLVGWVAETFSPRWALALGGIATLAACGYGFLRLPHLQLEELHERVDDTDESLPEIALAE